MDNQGVYLPLLIGIHRADSLYQARFGDIAFDAETSFSELEGLPCPIRKALPVCYRTSKASRDLAIRRTLTLIDHTSFKHIFLSDYSTREARYLLSC